METKRVAVWLGSGGRRPARRSAAPAGLRARTPQPSSSLHNASEPEVEDGRQEEKFVNA